MVTKTHKGQKKWAVLALGLTGIISCAPPKITSNVSRDYPPPSCAISQETVQEHQPPTEHTPRRTEHQTPISKTPRKAFELVRLSPKEFEATWESPGDPLPEYFKDVVTQYSVYDSSSRVQRFDSLEKDRALYGGKPTLEDWVKNDFPDAKMLVVGESSLKDPITSGLKNPTNQDLIDCPTCRYDHSFFGETAVRYKRLFGDKIEFISIIPGPLTKETVKHRSLTGVGVFPSYGIGLRNDKGSWQIYAPKKTENDTWTLEKNSGTNLKSMLEYLTTPEMVTHLE